MIAGRVPYDGPNAPQILVQTLSTDPFPDIRDINPDVKPELAIIIRRMCVKERDRRIASPAALIEEFKKIGYRPKDTPTPGVKYGHRADSAPTVVSMRDPLAFETQDVEIQDFVDRLKRRKRMRKLASTAAIAAAAILALLVLAWLVGVM